MSAGGAPLPFDPFSPADDGFSVAKVAVRVVNSGEWRDGTAPSPFAAGDTPTVTSAVVVRTTGVVVDTALARFVAPPLMPGAGPPLVI